MTGRSILFTFLGVGCAAAVPAAHGVLEKHHASHHGSHFALAEHEHGPSLETVRGRIDEALDALGLAPDARARAKAILESHFDEMSALLAKLHAGEIDHETAESEHERILGAAREELGAVLTPEQLERLAASLHAPDAAR